MNYDFRDVPNVDFILTLKQWKELSSMRLSVNKCSKINNYKKLNLSLLFELLKIIFRLCMDQLQMVSLAS